MLKRWSVLAFVLALIAAARVVFQSRTDIAVEVVDGELQINPNLATSTPG